MRAALALTVVALAAGLAGGLIGARTASSTASVAPPLSLSDAYFVSDDYENQPAPHVSMATIGARVEQGYVLVHVWFGANEPSAAARAAADAALSRLRVPRL